MTRKALTNTILLLAPAILLAAFTFWQFPESSLVTLIPAVIAGFGTGALLVLYRSFRFKLGTLTALAAVSIVSALLFAIVAAASPSCPIPEIESRCPAYAIGTLSVLGGLSPILVGVMLMPLYLIYLLSRWVYRVKKGERELNLELIKKIGARIGLLNAVESTRQDTAEEFATKEDAVQKADRRRNGTKKAVPTPKRTKPVRRQMGRS